MQALADEPSENFAISAVDAAKEDPPLKFKARRFTLALLAITFGIWMLPWGLMKLPRFLMARCWSMPSSPLPSMRMS